MGDDYWKNLVDVLARAGNAAIDVTVYKETGAKTGSIWTPNVQQPTVPMQPAVPAPQGLPQWLPWVLIGGAALLVVYRVAK